MRRTDASSVQRVRDAFVRFDTDHDGTISRAELIDILLYPGPHAFSSREAERAADAIIRKFDVSGDGSLQFGEFVSWWATRGSGLSVSVEDGPSEPPTKKWSSPLFFSQEAMNERLAASAAA